MIPSALEAGASRLEPWAHTSEEINGDHDDNYPASAGVKVKIKMMMLIMIVIMMAVEVVLMALLSRVLIVFLPTTSMTVAIKSCGYVRISYFKSP